MIKFDIKGMKELEKALKELSAVPQKHVAASSKAGMSIVLRRARAAAPEDTGALKSGIIMVGENARAEGKKVYRIIFDPGMNHVFQKKVKNPGSRGSNDPKKIAYYPVSQEYGYVTRKGSFDPKTSKYGTFDANGNFTPGAIDVVPGEMFVHNALTDNVAALEETIITRMKKKLDAEIAKAGLR